MLTRLINCCAITLLSCCVLALLALSPTSLAQQTKRITVMPAITDIDRYSVRMLTLAWRALTPNMKLSPTLTAATAPRGAI
jgi:hypothetical protein